MPASPKEREFVAEDGLRVRVVRSARRTRTVSAAWRDGAAVVSVPARLTRHEEEEWVVTMTARLRQGRDRARRGGGRHADEDLMLRAGTLSRRFLDGRAQPVSVRWVGNQRSRWGSATPEEGTIRLSDRLREMPEWVQDYVLVHELAHLAEPGGHGPKFRALEARYPRTPEAKAYLEGVSFAMNRLSAFGQDPADADAPGAPTSDAPQAAEAACGISSGEDDAG
jgi:predicted metal-dependent hydrolase